MTGSHHELHLRAYIFMPCAFHATRFSTPLAAQVEGREKSVAYLGAPFVLRLKFNLPSLRMLHIRPGHVWDSLPHIVASQLFSCLANCYTFRFSVDIVRPCFVQLCFTPGVYACLYLQHPSHHYLYLHQWGFVKVLSSYPIFWLTDTFVLHKNKKEKAWGIVKQNRSFICGHSESLQCDMQHFIFSHMQISELPIKSDINTFSFSTWKSSIREG